MAQTLVEIPSLKGSWTVRVPINFYCKLENRLGFFKSNQGWAPMQFPIEKEADFTFSVKDWGSLSKEELKVCNLYEDELTQIEKERNWKMCGIKTYPSESTKLFPSICKPMKAVDGRVTFKCGDDTKIDVDNKVVFSSSSDYTFLFLGVNAVDFSKCKNLN